MPNFSRTPNAYRIASAAGTAKSGPRLHPATSLVEVPPRAPESKAFRHINQFLKLVGKQISRLPSLKERRQATAQALRAEQPAGLARQPDEVRQAYAHLLTLMAQDNLSTADWTQIRANKALLANAHLTAKFGQADGALKAVNHAIQALHDTAAADAPTAELDDDFGLPQAPETLSDFRAAIALVATNLTLGIRQAGEKPRRSDDESADDFRQRQQCHLREQRFLKNAGALPWQKVAWSPRNAHASSLKPEWLNAPDAAHRGAQCLLALLDEPRAVIEELDGAWSAMLATAQAMPTKHSTQDLDRVKAACAHAADTFDKALIRLRTLGSFLTHDTWAAEKLSLDQMEGLHRFGMALLGLSKELAAPAGVNAQGYAFARRAANGDGDAIEQLRDLRAIDIELDFSSDSSEDDEAQDADLDSSTDTLAESIAERLAESTKALSPAREWKAPVRRHRQPTPSPSKGHSEDQRPLAPPSRSAEIDVQGVAQQEMERTVQIQAELRHAEIKIAVLDNALKELRREQPAQIDRFNAGTKLLKGIPLGVQAKRINKAEARYQVFQAKLERISHMLEAARAQQADLLASLSAIGALSAPQAHSLKAAAVAAAQAQDVAKEEAEKAVATAHTARRHAQGNASAASAAAEAEAVAEVMAKVYKGMAEARLEAESQYHTFIRDQPSASQPSAQEAAPNPQEPAVEPPMSENAPRRAYAPRRLARQQRAPERLSLEPVATSKSPLDADELKTLLTDLQSDLEQLGTSPGALVAAYDNPFSPRADALNEWVKVPFEASQAADHRYQIHHTEVTLVAIERVMTELRQSNRLNGRLLAPEVAVEQVERLEVMRKSALELESDQTARGAAMAKPTERDTQLALRVDFAAAARALAQAKAEADAAAQDWQIAQRLAALNAKDHRLALEFEVSAQVKAQVYAGMEDLHRRAEQALREQAPSSTARLDELERAILDEGQRQRAKSTQRSSTQQPRAKQSQSEPLQPPAEKLIQPAQALLVPPEIDDTAVLPQADTALADATQVLTQARSRRDELALLVAVRSAASKLIEATALSWATEHATSSALLRQRANAATASFDETQQSLFEQEDAVRNAEAALVEAHQALGGNMPDAPSAAPSTTALIDTEVEAAVQEHTALRRALEQARDRLETARLFDKKLVRPNAVARQASLAAVQAAQQGVQEHELLVDWAINRLNMAQAAQKEALVRAEPAVSRAESKAERTPWVAPQVPAPRVARSPQVQLLEAMQAEVHAQAHIDQLPSNPLVRFLLGKQNEYRMAVAQLNGAKIRVQGLQNVIAEQPVFARSVPPSAPFTASVNGVPQLEADLTAAQKAVTEARQQAKDASARQLEAFKRHRAKEAQEAIAEENAALARLRAHEAQVRALSDQLKEAQAAR